MRNRIALLIFILSSFFFIVNGQEEGRPDRLSFEKFKRQKAEYIIKEVGLTDAEARAFLPLTDELMRKKFEMNKYIRQESRKFRDKKNKTDAEYDALIDKILDQRVKIEELEKEYYQKYKKVLSSEKIYKYLFAEKNFMKKMVDKK